MEFIQEYLGIIVVGGFAAIIILLIVILRYNIFLSMFFSSKKFRVTGSYVFEPSDNSKKFSLAIFNNNVNDTRIISFGFIYKNYSLDYLKSYRLKQNISANEKTIIASRDCIGLDINALELKSVIKDMNRGKRRISKFRTFVSDSSGITYKQKARLVSRQLALMIKDDYLAEKAEKKAIRMQMKEEAKAIREKKRIERKIKNKARINKIKIKFRSIFRFKK
jgi:hypothetical protein